MSCRSRACRALPALCLVLAAACSRDRDAPRERRAAPPSSAIATSPIQQGPPRLLYLPDASPAPLLPGPGPLPSPGVFVRRGACPPEMVAVQSAFCIDRYEATLVDALTGKPLSPYYHPTATATRTEYERWQRLRSDAPTQLGRDLPVPAPPEWQLGAKHLEPMATSVPSSTPSGFLSGEAADRACKRAGKRLCKVEEWVVACRGQANRQFPYGHQYEEGRCNVFRASHPAELLHGSASEGHHDPRLNVVQESDGQPLLRATGATTTCRSEWNGDAALDMVGNLDEWVDDPEGTFVGGFYARGTNRGCDARVEAHGFEYYDYSLGARCCTSQ